jgi:ABC-type transporter Mla subunit MlaD
MVNDGVLTVFVIVVTVAVAMQGWAMFGMWLAVRKIPGQIDQIRVDVKQQLDPLTHSANDILTGTRDPLRTITANLAEISQTLRDRSTHVDTVVEDLVEKSRLQIIRADQLMSSLAEKVEATTEKVQETVLTPLNEISAVVKGVQSGLEFLFSRRRPAGAGDATQDEQMFI